MILFVFSGLPGAGKTTLARGLAERLGVAFLRIDTIEQAIRSAEGLQGDVGPAGYAIANAVAEANLRLGVSLIIDAVHPVEVSRAAWRGIALRTSARLLEIEVICSDPAEHRRRVETRRSDIPGLQPPTWASVCRLKFEPWIGPHLTVDTFNRDIEALLETLQVAASAGD